MMIGKRTRPPQTWRPIEVRIVAQLRWGACADAASAPVRAITSHAFSRVLWSNRSMEQVRQLLREALGALEKALSPQGVQVLKFGLLFAVLVAIDCWLIANQHAVFIESGKTSGRCARKCGLV